MCFNFICSGRLVVGKRSSMALVILLILFLCRSGWGGFISLNLILAKMGFMFIFSSQYTHVKHLLDSDRGDELSAFVPVHVLRDQWVDT